MCTVDSNSILWIPLRIVVEIRKKMLTSDFVRSAKLSRYRLFGQNENFGTKTGHHVTQKRLRPTQ